MRLSEEEIKAASLDKLVAYNESLMQEKEDIANEQLKVKAELNGRFALKSFQALPQAERDAIIQHINVGNLTVGR